MVADSTYDTKFHLMEQHIPTKDACTRVLLEKLIVSQIAQLGEK
jgi:hypothetical protein